MRGPAGADRRETLILVAVLAVLVLLGVVYTVVQQSDRPSDGGPPDSAPHGASLATSQPADVRR
ncbi:hypothetical protein [Nocardioides humi]|nr:hypothetical protein [Nocardioides humi]